MKSKVLSLLAQLNDSKMQYAIGGSMMLKLRSFNVVPKDIDIMVSESDFQDVVDLFQSVAIQVNKASHSPFKTKNFTTFMLDDVSIDLMAGFAYEHSEGIYCAIFDSLSIPDWIKIEGVMLPLMSLEEWYVLYSIMNRHEQVKLIEVFWNNEGLKHPQLLARQLDLSIPKSIVFKINELLNNMN